MDAFMLKPLVQAGFLLLPTFKVFALAEEAALNVARFVFFLGIG
jgi:hypothetical protein